MRQLLLYTGLACILFLIPHESFGQSAPNLGAASSFALFTAAGAFENDGLTFVNGDIGTDVGAFSGFPPGTVNGSIHVADAISAQAAADVDAAFGALSTVTCGQVIGTTLGNGQILTPNVYCLGAASVINGDLILNGQCNPDALFIIKINGALSTNVLSRVILTNGASLCNVYWQVNGAVELGEGSTFRGTIVANGAISLLEGAALFGRGLTRAGAIALHNNNVDSDMQPTASVITANGATTFCAGGSVTLSGNCGGVWSNGATTASITVTTSGNYSVTTTNDCGMAVSNNIIVTVNPLPVCTITGGLSICAGQTTQLCVAAAAASYLWSTGATTNCITVSAAGAYAVTVTSAAGCSSVCSATVILNPLPVCSITGDLSICAGQSTQLCVAAGAASYLWSNGATANCVTVSAAGAYAVTVTSAAGCTSVCSATVTLNPLPVCTITGDLSLCAGESSQLCVAAGAASYLWSTGATTNCITVSAAGAYAVTVTSAAGCSSVCSATVTLNPLPPCTITGDLSICAGQSTQLCVAGGAASYLWSTGATTNCIMVSATGSYAVTVTTAAGCSSVCSAAVVVSPLPICSITGNLSICAGQSTQLCVPAGAASYLWSNGATTNCITVSATGAYAVTVTSAAGCSSVCSATVTLNPLPVCSITGDLSICSGQTTQLCVPAGAASYLWSTGAITNCITVSATGAYAVTVTSAAGCSSVCSATVTASPLPICTITGNTLICQGQSTLLCALAGASSYLWSTGASTNCITVNAAGIYAVTVTDASGCSSVCDVTVTLNPVPPCVITGNNFICAVGQTTQLCVPPGAASYLWSTGATTECITVGAGTYMVTVTDENGCSSVCSETVTIDPQPVCTITGDPFICAPGQSTQLCVPAGATSYLWSTGATTNCITVMAAGIYSVTVMNTGGCSSICSVEVTINPPPACIITGNLSICPGQTTQLCVPAGAGSYLWSTGAMTNCITVNVAGTYSVTVTSVTGCSSICSETVILNPLPVCLITGNLSICMGQSTQLCVAAGAGSYLWSTGATTNCIMVNAAGIYFVTVTSATGCSSVCSATVTINPIPACNITSDDFVCAPGQTTQLCVPPGAAAYLWSTGATTNCITGGAGIYTVTITDANGCTSVCSETIVLIPQPVCTITGDNFICQPGQSTQLCVPAGAASYLWSTGAITNCIDVTAAGTYTVTVTYVSGCTSVCSETVTVTPQPVCNITGTNLFCAGGSAQICVPSGASSYLWNTGANTNCIEVDVPGTYTVTVTYASGCTSVCSETVTVNQQPPCTITGDDFICEPGQLTQLCVPAGATSYLWSTGATTNCIIASATGTYSVTVTDSNGCSSVCSKVVTLNPQPTCIITGAEFICDTAQFTQLCVPPGASSYLWSTGATTACINAGTGTYSVTITYSNGCTSVCSKTIVVNPLPVCTIIGENVICEGDSTQLCVTPGAASYVWSTGAMNNCITVGTAGTYTVTVTNAGGCTSICSITITVVTVPVCAITGNCTIVCGWEPTVLCAPAGCAQYLWCTGATTSCIQVSTAGTYCVTLTNANGCSTVCCVTVTGSPAPNCEITGNCVLPCSGQPTILCAPPGCASYWWSTGATTNCIVVTTPGNYCVTVTNAYGCSSVCSRFVTGGSVFNCNITGNCTLPCNGQPTVLCAPPGCASYWWSTGAMTSCISVSVPGNYCVTVTTADGCSSVCSTIVTGGTGLNCNITGNCVLPCSGQPTLLCAPSGYASYWWSTGAMTSCISVSVPGNYCVTVTTANGCSSVCSTIVTGGNAQDCHIAGNCTLPCSGEPTLLCAPPGCTSYSWSTGATTSCIMASLPGNYCVTVTYANGCTGSSCVVVTQGNTPFCDITGECVLPCSGEPTLLCAPSGCTSYLWSTGATTSCIIASQPGSYCVTVSDANGCTRSGCVIVTQENAPVCSITGDLDPAEGQSTLLCASIGAYSYQWNTGDTTSCIIADSAGNYAVTLTDAHGCSDSCAAEVSNFVIDTSDSDSLIVGDGFLRVRAYPNPFSDISIIEFENIESNSHVVMEVFKLSGNSILTLFDGVVEQGKVYTAEFSSEGLAEGVYVCRIVNGAQIINKKLILIR